METLNLSGTNPASEDRLRSLFWPSIQTSSDVDYLGSQGFWVCVVVGVLSFVMSVLGGHPIAGFFVLLIYYFGGTGVRERSRFAAATVLILFLTDFVGSIILTGSAAIGPASGVFRILMTALLVSNLRATWIAAQWERGSEVLPRFGDTWTEKFADRLPMWL